MEDLKLKRMRMNAVTRKAGIIKVIHRMESGADLCKVNLKLAQLAPMQRDPNPAHVASMTGKNFNKLAWVPPCCNLRDGIIYVADGGNRRQARLESGVNEVECEVYNGLTEELEASIFFLRNNNVRRMHRWKTFAAAVAGRHEPHTTILREIHAARLTTPLSVNGDASPDITSTKILEEAYSKKGGSLPLLRRFLRILRQGWAIKGRIPDGDAKNIQTLRGLLRFIQNTEMSDLEICALMRTPKGSPAGIRKAALNVANQTGKSRADKKQVYMVLCDLFGEEYRTAA